MNSVYGMSSEDYHSHPAVSKSGLDRIHRSLAHYFLPPRESGKAALFGSAYHTHVLENTLDRDYLISPNIKKQSNADKATWEQYYWKLKKEEKKEIAQADWDICHEMKEVLFQHPIAGEVFRQKGNAEVSMFWDEMSIPCKCRPDWYYYSGQDRIMIADLKTAESATPEGFQAAMKRYRYNVQVAWYTLGVSKVLNAIPDWVFIVQEKTPPYLVAVYTIGDTGIEQGLLEAMDDLRKLRDYYDQPVEGRWAGYPPIIQEIALPEI